MQLSQRMNTRDTIYLHLYEIFPLFRDGYLEAMTRRAQDAIAEVDAGRYFTPMVELDFSFLEGTPAPDIRMATALDVIEHLELWSFLNEN